MQSIKLATVTLFFTGLVACSLFHQQANDPAVFIHWANTVSHSPTVAILPFTNQTNQVDLPELVRVGFCGHFSPLSFNDRELDEVDETLNLIEKEQKKSWGEFSSQELGSFLGVDILIYGEVTDYTKIYAGVYSQIGVGAKIKMIDAQLGQTIWEDAYHARFHEGNIPFNQFLAVFSLIKTGANIRSVQELRVIDDLCRNLVNRIPRVTFPGENTNVALCQLQVASFRDLNRAQELRRQLAEKEYEAFIRKVEQGGVVWWRVLLGPFGCGEEIDKWKEKIKIDFGIEAISVKKDY